MPVARIQEWLRTRTERAVLRDVRRDRSVGAPDLPRSGAPARTSSGSIGKADPERRDPRREGRRHGRRAAARSASWSRAARTSRAATGTIPTRRARSSARSAIAPAISATPTTTASCSWSGRRHDMLKVGAHRVGAKEIEDVLHEFPACTKPPSSACRTTCSAKCRWRSCRCATAARPRRGGAPGVLPRAPAGAQGAGAVHRAARAAEAGQRRQDRQDTPPRDGRRDGRSRVTA